MKKLEHVEQVYCAHTEDTSTGSHLRVVKSDDVCVVDCEHLTGGRVGLRYRNHHPVCLALSLENLLKVKYLCACKKSLEKILVLKHT